MTALQASLDFILSHEGGYVDDSVDLGGVTNHGISFRFLKHLAPELADVDGDGDVDPDDIVAMTPAHASRIYRVKFWDALTLDRLSMRLSIAVMDTAVNMGRKTAVQILQQSANRLGANIAEDGMLGPRTHDAVAAFGKAETLLVKQYLLERIWRYQDIVRCNRKLSKFLFGWLNRVRDLDAVLSMDLRAIYGEAA